MTDLGYPPAASPVPGSMSGRTFGATFARLRIDTALVTFGTGLVGAAVLLSTIFTHDRGSLDGSTFTLGLLGALGLLGIAAAAYVLVHDPERRTVLAAYPGAAGAGAAGLVVLTAADFNAVSEWLAGLLTLVLAAVGFWFTRQVPYVVAGVAGLALFCARLLFQLTGLDNAHPTSGNLPSHILIWVSLGLWLFAALVTAGAWFLPGRHIVSVWIGAAALASNVALMIVLYVVSVIVNALLGAFSGLGGGSSSSAIPKFYTTGDVVVTLIFAALAIAGWGFLYLTSGVAGYRVLILTAGAYIPAVGALVIAVSRPSVWELVLGFVGGALLVAVLVLSLGGSRPGTPAGPTGPGSAPGYGTPEYGAPGYPAPGYQPPAQTPDYPVPGGYPPAQPPYQAPAQPPYQTPAQPPYPPVDGPTQGREAFGPPE